MARNRWRLLHVGVRGQGYELFCPKRSRDRVDMVRLATVVICDAEGQAQFRFWRQINGANRKLAMEALKNTEGWNRNQGWNVCCPVHARTMFFRFLHTLLLRKVSADTSMEHRAIHQVENIHSWRKPRAPGGCAPGSAASSGASASVPGGAVPASASAFCSSCVGGGALRLNGYGCA